MATNIFLNLCVKDLVKSKEFFSKLGYSFNPQFTNDSAACMVISENIYSMLITEKQFKVFTKKEIVNAHKATEVLTALSVDSKEKVDELLKKALAAGGTEHRPAQDHGFMYERSFNDLDGHVWEIFWMNPNHVQK